MYAFQQKQWTALQCSAESPSDSGRCLKYLSPSRSVKAEDQPGSSEWLFRNFPTLIREDL
jgi:hypothetical protein